MKGLRSTGFWEIQLMTTQHRILSRGKKKKRFSPENPRGLILDSSAKFFLANSMKSGNQESFLSKIIFYQSMWERKCHELQSMTHHQSIKKIKSHKPAGKALCPMTLACFSLLLQQFHSPGSYATSFASCC